MVLKVPNELNAGRNSRPDFYKNIAIVGSAPDATTIGPKLGHTTIVVAINNSWRAVPRYDFVVFADDLPDERKPPCGDLYVRGRTAPHYLDAMSRWGGLALCGATTSIAAGYWCLSQFPLAQVSYFAADMLYKGDKTHFYGRGSPDPLRHDVSLQSIEAKFLRLFYYGLRRGTLVLNASAQDQSRLPLPRLRCGSSLSRLFVNKLSESIARSLGLAQDAARRAELLEGLLPVSISDMNYTDFNSDQMILRLVREIDLAWLEMRRIVERIEIELVPMASE